MRCSPRWVYLCATASLALILLLTPSQAHACVLCDSGSCPFHGGSDPGHLQGGHALFAGGDAESDAQANDHPAEADGQSLPFEAVGRWSMTASGPTGTRGTPITLTWGIIPDGTAINAGGFGNGPSDLVATFDSLYGTSVGGIETRPWFALFESVFDRLEQVAGLTYQYEPNDSGFGLSTVVGQLGVNPDIRIGGHFIDGEVPGVPSVVAVNYFPNNGDMILDTANVLFYGNTQLNSLRFRNTVTHEAGHGVGLSHVESDTSGFLMEPRIVLDFDGPQFDDILGLQRGYGDTLEKNGGNDTLASATHLGSLNLGETLVVGSSGDTTFVLPTDIDFISVDDTTDLDYYNFTVTQPALIRVSLDPVGPSYRVGSQGGVQELFDASQLADLALGIFVDGQNVQFLNSVGLGETEWSQEFLALPGVNYQALAGSTLDTTGFGSQIQMYRLTITAVPEPGAFLLAAVAGLVGFVASCRRS